MVVQNESFFLVALYGATGVGKTAVSLRLAEALGCSIISSDSRQCYREMSIGTARPSASEVNKVPHFFVGTHSVTERFSAGQFEVEALGLLADLRRRSSVAILTGGSMLYMDALTKGIDAFPVPDLILRRSLTDQLQKEGVLSLFNRLSEVDPTSASRIDRLNGMRVLRALEVTLQTGRPYSAWLAQEKEVRPFSLIAVGIQRPVAELHTRINERVDTMIANGLVEEVRALLPYRSLPALQTVGYLELFDYLDGKCSLAEAIELIKLHTRQYARKQMKWWRRDPNIVWFDANDYDRLSTFVQESIAEQRMYDEKQRDAKDV